MFSYICRVAYIVYITSQTDVDEQIKVMQAQTAQADRGP